MPHCTIRSISFNHVRNVDHVLSNVLNEIILSCSSKKGKYPTVILRLNPRSHHNFVEKQISCQLTLTNTMEQHQLSSSTRSVVGEQQHTTGVRMTNVCQCHMRPTLLFKQQQQQHGSDNDNDDDGGFGCICSVSHQQLQYETDTKHLLQINERELISCPQVTATGRNKGTIGLLTDDIGASCCYLTCEKLIDLASFSHSMLYGATFTLILDRFGRMDDGGDDSNFFHMLSSCLVERQRALFLSSNIDLATMVMTTSSEGRRPNSTVASLFDLQCHDRSYQRNSLLRHYYIAFGDMQGHFLYLRKLVTVDEYSAPKSCDLERRVNMDDDDDDDDNKKESKRRAHMFLDSLRTDAYNPLEVSSGWSDELNRLISSATSSISLTGPSSGSNSSRGKGGNRSSSSNGATRGSTPMMTNSVSGSSSRGSSGISNNSSSGVQYGRSQFKNVFSSTVLDQLPAKRRRNGN